MTNPPDLPPDDERTPEPPSFDDQPTAAIPRAGEGVPPPPAATPPPADTVPPPPPDWGTEDATALMPAVPPPGGIPPGELPPGGGPGGFDGDGEGEDDGGQRTRNTLITIIVILAVALVGLVIFLLTRGGDDTPTSTTTTTTITGDSTTSAPDETSTTTVAETTTTATPTTTTTTTIPDTTTTTVAETTTTAVAGPDTRLVAGNLCVAGWWEGGWQRAPTASELPVSGGESYQSIGIGSSPSTVTGAAPVRENTPVDYWRVPLTPEPPGDDAGVAVQTSGNLFPRNVTNGSTNDPGLITRTRDLLVAAGIADPVVELTQVVQTDLDGDGITDTAVAAFHNEGASLIDTEPGSYGLLWVLKTIAGQEEVLILEIAVVPDAGNSSALLVQPGITGFADVNHDGRLELISSGRYYEGAWIYVWEFVNDDQGFVDVLGCEVGA